MRGIEAYPLSWPAGLPRTRQRESARFHQNKTVYGSQGGSWRQKTELSVATARDQVIDEIERLGGSQVVLSTNIELRNDGLPYSNRRKPEDPGVAVYFQRKGKPTVFACDKFDEVAANLRAIAKTIEALRGIERWGSSDMLERAFQGFQALPQPQQRKQWFEVLGCAYNERSLEKVARKRNQLALESHPDHGGSDARMAEINAAYAEAVLELS